MILILHNHPQLVKCSCTLGKERINPEIFISINYLFFTNMELDIVKWVKFKIKKNQELLSYQKSGSLPAMFY